MPVRTTLPSARHLVSTLLAMALALVTVAAVPACKNGDKAGPTETERKPEPPPTPAEIAAAVKGSEGKPCQLDEHCAMYLRCMGGACNVPPAVSGEPGAQNHAVGIVTDKGEAQFRVELAATARERNRGLMFRQEMKDDWGMLFIYPRDEQLTFWMKNTYIPLDMVFINDAMRVVGVVADTTPHSLDSRKVDGESRYVLELKAGTAARYGIKADDKVVFANIDVEASK